MLFTARHTYTNIHSLTERKKKMILAKTNNRAKRKKMMAQRKNNCGITSDHPATLGVGRTTDNFLSLLVVAFSLKNRHECNLLSHHKSPVSTSSCSFDTDNFSSSMTAPAPSSLLLQLWCQAATITFQRWSRPPFLTPSPQENHLSLLYPASSAGEPPITVDRPSLMKGQSE